MPLPDNALDGFRNGACLDLRVRFAMELLAHSPIFSGLAEAVCLDKGKPSLLGHPSPYEREKAFPKFTARVALDISTELFALAEARGLIAPFAEGLGAHLKAHVGRQVEYQLEQGKEAQRQQAEAVRIPQAVHRAFNQ